MLYDENRRMMEFAFAACIRSFPFGPGGVDNASTPR